MLTTESARIIVLIPAFNEANNISWLVNQLEEYLPVLVVDDGSIDDTAELAQEAGAHVLRQKPNQGKGAALQAGFRWAISNDLEAALILDGDGQHDPREIPKFLSTYQTCKADLIIGARDFNQMPPVRRLANTLGRLTFSWALGRQVRDNQSGYRLVSRRLMETMLSSKNSGFEFEVEMVVNCVRRGFELKWVPIRTIYAGETSHINPLKHLINFLRLLWWTKRVSREV